MINDTTTSISSPYYLIQGAMDTETAFLIDHLQNKKTLMLGNWTFYTGTLGEKQVPVIISKTFQGMANASAATALALSFLPIKALINQGIAGGYDPQLHTGDIVLAQTVLPMGAVIRPYLPEGGGIAAPEMARPLPLEIFNRSAAQTEKVLSFTCDKALLSTAQTMPFHNQKLTGTIGSADEWNNERDRIRLMRDRYGILCEDMESAAAAQMAVSYGVPFLAVRILSNTILYHEELDESQGEVLQRFIADLLQQLP